MILGLTKAVQSLRRNNRKPATHAAPPGFGKFKFLNISKLKAPV